MSESSQHRFFKTSKLDLVLISLILFLALGAGIWLARTSPWQPAGELKAFVYHDSHLVNAVDLDQSGVWEILNGKMRLEVKDRRIRISYSDCHRQICTHTGWIKKAGETIVCVPNHVMIEIKSAGPGER